MGPLLEDPLSHTSGHYQPSAAAGGAASLVEVSLGRLAETRPSANGWRGYAILRPNLRAHGGSARLVQRLGADIIGVAVLEEGILLRESGIRAPILVLGGMLGNQVPGFLRHGLTMTASSIEKLRQVDEAAAQMGVKARVHLKVDTGMERIGCIAITPRLPGTSALQHLEVEGICRWPTQMRWTERACLQIERFPVLAFYEKRGLPPPPLRHIANSGAILQLPEATFDMVRPGLLLYGVSPAREIPLTVAVRPALSWKSRVVYFKVIQPGHPVGYGSTWQPDHPVRAVTVPVGYGDGYFRSMSHQAQVLIRGKKYPVVRRISMDQVVVNIEQDSAFNDDEVILIGEMGDEAITCYDLAEWAGTIPYEILTNINTRVPRVYV
jgi:alanine racemase